MAIRGGDIDGVISHADRGSEYTAARYRNLCRRLGVVQSMDRVGCALDNAPEPKRSTAPSRSNTFTATGSAPEPKRA